MLGSLFKNILTSILLLMSLSLYAQPSHNVDLERVITEPYVNTICPNDSAHRARKGIIIIGDSGSVRACSPFAYNKTSLVRYANTVNTYRDTFGTDIRVFCMPIPTSAAFYLPDTSLEWSGDERKAINTMFAALNDSIQPVNIFTTLSQHVSEAIYSRTDHHWAPLGAYYAAKHFAHVAGVPFTTLDQYDTLSMPGYVGTMFMYSRDSMVIKSPEDFVYYMPRNAEYTTLYTNYKLDKKRKRVISKGQEHEGDFFLQNFVNPEKPGASYCVFGGGDSKLIKIRTNVGNGRRLIILKDSFGNALTAYLLSSFEEIHVVDCRYFTLNIVKYINDNGITDILFANNLTHAQNENTTNMYLQYLIQKDM